MFNILNNIKITSSVSAIQIINNNIYVLGSNYLLNIFKRDDFSTIDNMPLFENANHRHIYDKSYAISNNIDIYISQSENYNGHIFSKEGIKLTKEDSLDFHDNSVSVSKFSNDSTLIAIGDEDGKVFFYRSDIDQLLFSLPPMADAISSISFSDDDKFTAIASYDKSINIYSMTANKKISTTAISDVVEDMLFLDNGQKLIGVTRDKKIFSYDVLTDEISYGDFEFSEWPTTIKRVGKDSLIVGSRGQNLYLIKTNSLEILKEIELPNTGVKTLFIHKNYLYVGYVDGNIDTIDTQYKLQEFEINLNINKFEEASSLLEKNIFLLIETIADKYDMEWENILNQAKILLSEHKNDEALALVEPFFFDKKKEKAYNFLNANKNNFIHFNKLIQEDKVMIALMFADIHEYLKDTAEYRILDKKWQAIYQKCRLMLEKNDDAESAKAKEILQKFYAVSSKEEEIDNLLTNYRFYIRAHLLVKERKFKLYFTIVKNKPFLMKEEIYKKVIELGNLTYLKLIDLEQKKEYEKANKIATYLLDFPTFKERANDCLLLISAKSELIQNISNDDTVAVYNNIVKNSELEGSELFLNYHKEFNLQKEKALHYAKDADYDHLYTTLAKYIKINYLANSIALIFKIFYLAELKNFIKLDFDAVKWGEIIDNYTKIYGLDNEMLSFVKKSHLTQYLENTSNNKGEKSFENIIYPKSLLVS